MLGKSRQNPTQIKAVVDARRFWYEINYCSLFYPSTRRTRYCTRHGLLILSLETYNLYSIASQLKRAIDPVTSGILPPYTVYSTIIPDTPRASWLV